MGQVPTAAKRSRPQVAGLTRGDEGVRGDMERGRTNRTGWTRWTGRTGTKDSRHTTQDARHNTAGGTPATRTMSAASPSRARGCERGNATDRLVSASRNARGRDARDTDIDGRRTKENSEYRTRNDEVWG